MTTPIFTDGVSSGGVWPAAGLTPRQALAARFDLARHQRHGGYCPVPAAKETGMRTDGDAVEITHAPGSHAAVTEPRRRTAPERPCKHWVNARAGARRRPGA